jgi:hypothetical protein
VKKEMVVVLLIASLFLFCSSCSGDLPDKGVAILSPKANDIVQAGASYEIQWKTENPNPESGVMVTIEFSKNGGKSWEEVEDNVPKAGKYLWKVPKIDSAQCKIRVFYQARPEYRGTSGLFAVK